MKKFLTTSFIVLFLIPPMCVHAADDDFLDMDMNLIDSPALMDNSSARRAVTQEQFDKALEQKMTRKKGLIQKFKDFFGRNKPENDPVLKNFKSDGLGEMGMSAQDIQNSKPNVVLAATIVDSYGKIVPKGHYQLAYSEKEGVKLINFMQGATIYGSLRAHPTRDNWDENVIIYARITYPSEEVARVIFSNLDTCVEGFARIAE